MMRNMLKQLFVLFLLVTCCPSGFSQEVKVHIMQRGETPESIASKYGLTLDELKKGNPAIDKMYYVGMKLTIPEKKIIFTKNGEVKQPGKLPVEDIPSNGNGKATNKKNYELDFYAGVSLNNNYGDDIEDTKNNTGFHAGITARYIFATNFFADISFGYATKGYKQENTQSSGQYWDDEGANYDSQNKITMQTSNIDMPIHFGYRIKISDALSVDLKLGCYLTYALSGKRKNVGTFTFYPDIHSSETDFISSTTYIKDVRYKRFGVGLDAGLGVRIKKHFILSGSYQHGLTVLLEDANIYEKNFLISAGYCF